MISGFGLVIDLDRCLGCYACEVGCKEWNRVPGSEKWIVVQELGPTSVNGRLRTDFFPLVMKECNFCESSREKGYNPFCVSVCPTQALLFCDKNEIVRLLNSGRRYQICKLDL